MCVAIFIVHSAKEKSRHKCADLLAIVLLLLTQYDTGSSSKTIVHLIHLILYFIDKLIGVQGVRLLQDRRAGETLKSETYGCGSPPAPRKAKHLERKSTATKDSSESLLRANH
ncbi:hypothetical protein AWM68_10605 [Fictibacillus phosphorivorans]|uniref:Uncharacterized protein n=1 Tax=Fictibacillus phosphorivorans TaxID=1221500 RepID=A0A163Q5H5_9BACL|nr:hypothetical protein AWM68_10605 [Fictibacillus phosphorivorans]